MAAASGSQDIDVSRTLLGEAIRRHPGRYDFFQVVRLIERLYRNRTPVGEFGPPEREGIRFAVNNSLSFPPSQIHSIDWQEKRKPVLTVNFIGLTGPKGALPDTYTSLVRDRARSKDTALRDFFDLFHHRILSLFYQAWKKYRFFVEYERDREDRFSNYLRSFVGLGTEGLKNRKPAVLRDETFLFYCGLLSLQCRSAAALEQILSDYLGVTVAVEQFVGAWYSVSRDDQCSLGAERPFSDALGTAVAGDEVWDHQPRARITIGPVGSSAYAGLLPAGRGFAALRAMLQFFAGFEIEFEICLVMKREDVPQCNLNGTSMLGWTTWIKSGDSFDRSPADTVLVLN